jgi:hypothetical protein
MKKPNFLHLNTLVPTTSTDVVIYEEPNDTPELIRDLKKIKSDLNEIEESMEIEQKLLAEMYDKINPEAYALIKELEFIRAKHEAYRHAARDQFLKGAYDTGKTDDEYYTDFTGEGSDDSFISGLDFGQTSGQDKKLRKLCAKIFKKISALTHPDKLGGSDILRDVYEASVIAYTILDLEELNSILSNLNASNSPIKETKSKARQRLSLQLERYKKLLESSKEEFQIFMESEDSILSTIFKQSGYRPTSIVYKRMLRVSIDEYEQALERIRDRIHDKDILLYIDAEYDFEDC